MGPVLGLHPHPSMSLLAWHDIGGSDWSTHRRVPLMHWLTQVVIAIGAAFRIQRVDIRKDVCGRELRQKSTRGSLLRIRPLFLLQEEISETALTLAEIHL